MKTIAAISALLLITAVLPGCDWTENGDYEASDTFSFVVPVQQQPRFRLTGINGTIDIVGVPGLNEVRISGEKRVRANSQSRADAGLAVLDIDRTASAQQILVETDQPSDSDGRTFTVDYTIEIPADMDVTINHVNGDVDVTDTSGNLQTNLVNGTVTADVTLQAGGDIEVNLVNGTIDLTIPSSTSATLSCSLTNGTIATSDLNLTNVSSTSLTLEATLGTGDGTIGLFTVNGTISVDGR